MHTYIRISSIKLMFLKIFIKRNRAQRRVDPCLSDYQFEENVVLLEIRGD